MRVGADLPALDAGARAVHGQGATAAALADQAGLALGAVAAAAGLPGPGAAAHGAGPALQRSLRSLAELLTALGDDARSTSDLLRRADGR